MNGWVYEGFNKTYNDLGVDFDSLYYESETYLIGKEIIKHGLEKQTFYKKNDGSVWIDLSDQGLDEKLLLRSDGHQILTIIFHQDLDLISQSRQNHHFFYKKSVSLIRV